jgi:hypothetical protein
MRFILVNISFTYNYLNETTPLPLEPALFDNLDLRGDQKRRHGYAASTSTQTVQLTVSAMGKNDLWNSIVNEGLKNYENHLKSTTSTLIVLGAAKSVNLLRDVTGVLNCF